MIELPAWTPTELAWMRALVVIAMLSLVHPERPGSFTKPLGIARFVPLGRLVGWRSLDRVRLVLAVLFAAGLASPLPSVGLAVLTLVSVTAASSDGAVNHGRHLLLLVLAAHAAADTLIWLDDQFDRELLVAPDRAAVWSVQVILAMYFAAGVSKVINSGGTWIERSKNLELVILRRSYLAPGGDRSLPGRFGALLGARPRLIALAASGGLLVEVASPVALIHPIAMFATGVALIAMHLLNGYFLRLSFSLNQALIGTFLVLFSLPLG